MRIQSKFMIGFISLRVLYMVYMVIILETKAGKYGLYQFPVVFPFYVMFFILCFIHLKYDLSSLFDKLSFHIFAILFTFIDLFLYITSINPDSPF